MDNELENTGDKVERDDKGRLIKGNVSLNPNGRPKGSKNFLTDFEEAIKDIKDQEGNTLTTETIIKTGIIKMLKGDARLESLYRDLLDRIYGKPIQKTEMDVRGDLIVQFAPAFNKNKDANTT